MYSGSHPRFSSLLRLCSHPGCRRNVAFQVFGMPGWLPFTGVWVTKNVALLLFPRLDFIGRLPVLTLPLALVVTGRRGAGRHPALSPSVAYRRLSGFTAGHDNSQEYNTGPKVKKRTMKPISLAILLFFAIRAGAQQQINVYDTDGNFVTGTLGHGHLYLTDSHGNNVFGTVKDGNVNLNTSSGVYLFGTIRDGNVFLQDDKGITTGTIRNGSIFLSHSDGSITYGSYRGSDANLTTTSPTTENTKRSREQERTVQPKTYETGYAL